MPYVETEKARLYYELHGDQGPVVTFAHGGGGNTLEWFQQVPALLPHYRVLLFDQHGWGRSACAVDDMQFAYFPTDALAVMDAAGVAMPSDIVELAATRSFAQALRAGAGDE